MTKSGRWAAAVIWTAALLAAAGCAEKENTAGVDMQEESDTALSGETGLEQENFVQELEEQLLSAGDDLGDSETEIVYAEEQEYPALAEFLAEYYRVPGEQLAQTRYYYNYIDLDDDGTDEIFAVVIGEYTETEAGRYPAVILRADEADGFTVFEAFPEISTPVIISSRSTNGLRDIILDTYGLGIGRVGYEICHYQPGGGYQTEANEQVDGLEMFPCTQILSNNLIDDMDQGEYMTLDGEGVR